MKRTPTPMAASSRRGGSDGGRSRRGAHLSLLDLDIPARTLLSHAEELRYGERIQAAFARLRRLVPLTAVGLEEYVAQMARVAAGTQIVVAWFPLREGLEKDMKAVNRALERARRSLDLPAPRGRRASGEPGREQTAIRSLDRARRILGRYPLDPETVFAWGRAVSESAGRNALSSLERDVRARRLARRIVAEIELCRDALVLPNLRLVLKDVFRYHPTGMRRSDLFQEGILGLHRAVFRFDPTRKTRFSTYATYWIRQAIRKALIDRSRLIRIPQAVQEQLRKPEPEMAEREVVRVRRVMNETVSMSKDERVDPLDQLSFEAVRDPSDAADDEFHVEVVPEAVENALKLLSGREREVVRRRYGIGGDRRQTLEEIGTALHLSRERIRQIEREALGKMRRGRELQAVYEDLN